MAPEELSGLSGSRARFHQYLQNSQSSTRQGSDAEATSLSTLIKGLIEEFREKRDRLDAIDRLQDPDLLKLEAEITTAFEHQEKHIFSHTQFPNAGYINLPVLRLVDSRFEFWNALGRPGNLAPGLIEMLHKAMSVTFQSPRIRRFLFFACDKAGDHKQAEYALDTYIALVKKAKLTGSETVNEILADDTGSRGIVIGEDLDSDEDILYTFSDGARYLSCRVGHVDHGLELANDCLKCFELWEVPKTDEALLAHIWHTVGLAKFAKLPHVHDADEYVLLQESAAHAYEFALKLNPKQTDVLYHLALQQAFACNVSQSLSTVKKILKDDRSVIHCYQLYALLVSSQKRYEEAMTACDVGLSFFARMRLDQTSFSLQARERRVSVELLLTKALLLEHMLGPDEAIGYFVHIMSHYKAYVDRSDNDKSPRIADGLHADKSMDSKSEKSRKPHLLHLHPRKHQTPSGNSGYGQPEMSGALVPYGLRNGDEKQPAEASSPVVSTSIDASKAILHKIWITYMTILIRSDRLEEAELILEEVKRLAPDNNASRVVEATLLDAQGKSQGARDVLEEALIADCSDVTVMILLSKHLVESTDRGDAGSRSRAEQLLNDAKKSSGRNSPEVWYYLGLVHRGLNEPQIALQAFQRAIHFDDTRPIRPWDSCYPLYLL